MTIRRIPSDFVVEEVPTAGAQAAWRGGPAGRGHAVYRLSKTSLTTPEACAGLARALGRGGAASYAGLKDRHAQTTQYVSVEWERGEAPARAEGKGWSAELAGWSGEALTAEAIACNRFTIRVRGLTRPASDEMDARAAVLGEAGEDGRRLWVINYFGDQRFGSARAGRGFMARRLIEGDFEGALRLAIATPARKDAARVKQARRLIAERWGDWGGLLAELGKGAERRVVERLAAGGSLLEGFAALPHFDQVMAIESYQSYLWNATARRLAEEIAAESGGVVVRAEGDFGAMVFPSAASLGDRWRTLQVPMLAAGSELKGEWAGAARAALEEEGIRVEQLRVEGLRRPAFGEAWRPLAVAAERFELGGPEADEFGGAQRRARTARFELPRGAYATVVLRALGQ